MTAYAFWNNKGGVGKSFLAFIAASEYAHANPDSDVYVIDLCPQANVSETLLGGSIKGGAAISDLQNNPIRKSVSGYLDARLNSPFSPLEGVERFVSTPSEFNSYIPENLRLICGDNLLEIQSDAMRQTSQLSVPVTAWSQVICWIRDLVLALRRHSGIRDAVFIIDCNPSFAIFTQMALAASDGVVIPFTADDSSRRGIENIVALIYGYGDKFVQTYARMSFSTRAKENEVALPRLHTFISNRVTMYKGEPSSAFRAASASIEKLMDNLHSKHRSFFISPKSKPSKGFLYVPDYHSACVVASSLGMPLHKLKPGHHRLGDETVQLNKSTLDAYKKALEEVVEAL